ncbi:MAG: peptidylprolyl isomerase [Oscillospiraceae bacterium]|nr:peptidylprolyl isomerase [Oscillospiraceae bacterium]
MKKTKIISLLLAAAMLVTMLSGCSLFGGKTVMKIGDNSISEEIYSAALAYADNFFQQSYGISLKDYLDTEMADGMTGADMLKENADGLVKEFESVALFAKENGIEITKEERKTIEENKKAQIEAAGGRKAFLDSLTESGANEAFFDYIIERQQLYAKVYSQMFTGEGEFAPKAEDVVAKLSTGYARVKHVLIKATEGDADYEEKKAAAQKIADRAKAGEDFDALIKEIADGGDGDPGMQSSPNGYVIDAQGYTHDGSGQMITEFTEASHALAVNGVSGVVPSPYGFHIIKRYPFDEAYITANYAEYEDVSAMDIFGQKMSEFMQNVEVEYTKAYDKIDVHAIFGVEKPLGGAASGEHSEDDGHDHSADAEGDAEAGDTADGGIEVGEAVPQE